jgi:signal transduction histidine kinase
LGEVVSSIAHEIRNPLTSISGSVELIEKRIHNKLNRNQIKLMDSVVEESERVKIIFNGLLDYSRVPELCCETVVVEEFLDRILLLLKHQEEFNKHIEVTRRYKGKKIQMTADPEYLQQAMTNIVLNSIQAMPDGGQLDIDCERHIEGVKILTQDTGKGMSKKELQSLFMPFKTTKRNGTGLGMAHAYKVVNQHGGKLTVHSRKHKGTQVELFLPIV